MKLQYSNGIFFIKIRFTEKYTITKIEERQFQRKCAERSVKGMRIHVVLPRSPPQGQ